MLHFSRLMVQNRARAGLSSQLKASTYQARASTSNAASSLWSAIEQSGDTCLSAIRRFTSYAPLASTTARTLRAETATKVRPIKTSAPLSARLSSRHIAGSLPSTQLHSSIKRGYQTQWNFRNAYQSMGGARSLFSWRRPLGLIIAANVGVYLMWSTVGVTKDGHKWMIENFMVSATTYKEHPMSLFNAAFSHTGLLHLGFNMVAIGTIGSTLQTVMGPMGFIGLTVASALASSVCHLLYTAPRKPDNWQPRAQLIPMYILPDGTPILEDQIEAYRRVHGQEVAVRKIYGLSGEDHVWAPGLGASGVASAFFGYSAVLWPRKQFTVIFWSTHASRLLTLFAGASVFSMIFFPDSNIGHAAHMGGLAVGIAAAVLTRGRALKR